jgi:F-type H+-transporting ATPase subunit b
MAANVDTVAHTPTAERAAETDATTIGQQPTTASTEQAAVSAGLPQFQFQHWPGQIAYLLILFAILYVLMSRVFTPRIRRIFDERTRVINEALTSARAVQTEAAVHAEDARRAVDDARTKAQKTAADAKAKAAEEAKARQATLEAELNVKLSHAEARIRDARDQAMSGVVAIAEDAAHTIVEKLTGVALGPDEAILASPAKG